MNKQAFDGAVGPTQLFLLAALSGAGGVSAAQLLQSANRARQDKEDKFDRNELIIDVPSQTFIQDQEDLHQHDQHRKVGAELFSSAPLIGLLGLVAGGVGAKSLYDHYQDKEMKQELDEVKRRYHEKLIQAKTSEETPFVDGLCEELAKGFEKSAESPHSLLTSLQNLVPFGGTIADAIKVAVLISGAGVFGAMYRADQKRRKAEVENSYPDRVTLNEPPRFTQSSPHSAQQRHGMTDQGVQRRLASIVKKSIDLTNGVPTTVQPGLPVVPSWWQQKVNTGLELMGEAGAKQYINSKSWLGHIGDHFGSAQNNGDTNSPTGTLKTLGLKNPSVMTGINRELARQTFGVASMKSDTGALSINPLNFDIARLWKEHPVATGLGGLALVGGAGYLASKLFGGGGGRSRGNGQTVINNNFAGPASPKQDMNYQKF